MDRRHRLGAWGEDQALAFLTGCGYRLLDRRYRRPGGEVDLIMERDGFAVFVEVKTRGPGALDDPAAWVDRRKLGRMRRMARRWLAENPTYGRQGSRFDVVAVHWRGFHEGAALHHLVAVE